MRRERQKQSRGEERPHDTRDRQAQEIERLRDENERLRKQLEEQAKRIAALVRWTRGSPANPAWLLILVTGSYLPGLYDFGAGALRWRMRFGAYMLLMVDEYPPRCDQRVDAGRNR